MRPDVPHLRAAADLLLLTSLTGRVTPYRAGRSRVCGGRH